MLKIEADKEQIAVIRKLIGDKVPIREIIRIMKAEYDFPKSTHSYTIGAVRANVVEICPMCNDEYLSQPNYRTSATCGDTYCSRAYRFRIKRGELADKRLSRTYRGKQPIAHWGFK